MRILATLAFLLVAAAAIVPELVGVGAPGLGGMQVAMLGVALAILLVGLLLGRLDGRYLLAGTMTLLALSAVAGLLTLGEADIGWMLWQLQGRVVGRPPLRVHIADPQLGWVNEPAARADDIHYDYRVTYHIDPQGRRANGPDNESISDEDAVQVLCLGCSFTFGQGVEDRETYVAQWERLAAGKMRIRNAGVNGWGTVQAMLLLQQELQGQNRPQVVTYGFIPVHANRNSNRENWLKMLGQSDRKKPVVKLVGNTWVFDRLVGADEGRSASQALEAEETELTLQSILQMNKMCQAAAVPFYCLLLGPDRMPDTPESIQVGTVVDFCQQHDIPWVDCTDLPLLRFPHDGHPTPSWHQQVAARLAEAIPMVPRSAAASQPESEQEDGT